MQNNSNTPQNFDPNRRLKKVKRPIKRYIPGTQPQNIASGQGQTPTSAPAQNLSATPVPPEVSLPEEEKLENIHYSPVAKTDFNIDDVLDGNVNLPANSQEKELDSQAENFQPKFIDESDITPPKIPFMEQIMQGNMFTMKGMALIAVCVFVVGIFFAKLFFTQQTVVRDGLQGVVFNPEVPRGRARCGVAERTQGCVLYIMNPQRQELTGRDFYDLASQLTSRQRFVIETGNMRYSNVKIRPGDIAQLNIPPLQ